MADKSQKPQEVEAPAIFETTDMKLTRPAIENGSGNSVNTRPIST